MAATLTPDGAVADSCPRLTVSQDSLWFPLPVTHSIENVVELRSEEDRKVAFRLRTSNPRRYCVRPKNGVLHPREQLKVRFTLLIGGSAPPPPESSEAHERFLVEARFAEGGVMNETFWHEKDGSTTKIPLICRFPQPTEVPRNVVVRPRSPRRSSSRSPSRRSTIPHEDTPLRSISPSAARNGRSAAREETARVASVSPQQAATETAGRKSPVPIVPPAAEPPTAVVKPPAQEDVKVMPNRNSPQDAGTAAVVTSAHRPPPLATLPSRSSIDSTPRSPMVAFESQGVSPVAATPPAKRAQLFPRTVRIEIAIPLILLSFALCSGLGSYVVALLFWALLVGKDFPG